MFRKTFSTTRNNSVTSGFICSFYRYPINSIKNTFRNISSLSKFDAVVFGAYKDGSLTDSAAKLIPETLQQKIKEQLQFSGIKGKLGETKLFYNIGGEDIPKKIAVVGLGTHKNNVEEEFEALGRARKSAAIGVRSLREIGAKNIGVDVMTHEHGAAEGATLGLYSFDSLKSENNRKSPINIEPIGVSSKIKSSEELSWDTGLIYATAQNNARELAETPANLMTPTHFVSKVRSFLKDNSNVKVIVHEKEWVIEKGMNSFLSVAKGSNEPLKFLEIHYTGGKENKKPLALVGKGITFDSGGISLKPSSKMAEMKGDMGGAAAVISSLYGIVKLGLPINVVVSVPLCENMPSGHAIKPGDVIKAMNGKSIEIEDTDAEGRLILADALYYTSSTYQPHSLIDIATLTGSIHVSLGEIYSGVFTNSKKLWKQLSNSGKITNDPFWRMPLNDGYIESLKKSIVADLGNDGERGGGASIAATFLKEFELDDADEEKKIRYAHIDMAGSMLTSQDSGYNPSTASSTFDHSVDLLNAVSAGGDVITPFLPLFSIVSNVVDKLNIIYENAKCNQKICLALMDRVEIVQQATKSLQRKRKENEKNFCNQQYYNSWIRFTYVLKNIRKFAKDATQQQSLFQKYINANAVKAAFDKNIKEFEDACRDLQFSVAMYSEEQREQENKQILEDIFMLNKTMNEVSDDVKMVLKQVNILTINMEQLTDQISKRGGSASAKTLLNESYKAQTIQPSELQEPNSGSDNVRGTQKTVRKKIYRSMDVACKKFQTVKKNDTADSQRVQTELAILSLLGKCTHIITFYGLSSIEQDDVMVFEWASHGNLKEVYTDYTISWTKKLQFISDIFCGLSFIINCGVLHHDVRCENILITKNWEAKISNFKTSRQVKADTTPRSNLSDYVRWLAPEKLRDLDQTRYTHKCEMFSFGMLVWELCYQMVPYKSMKLTEIQDHVKNKRRENLGIQFHPSPIAQELAELIKQTWNDDPELRPSYLEVQTKIKNLESQYISSQSPRIFPKNKANKDIPYIDLGQQSDQQSDNDSSISVDIDLLEPKKMDDHKLSCANIPTVKVLKPFEDGVKAHKENQYKKAYECFNEHANLGHSLAKYYKGYYLEKGLYVEKNEKEGENWIKMAAEEGVPDAQLRYASILKKDSKDSSKNNQRILHYLKQAADMGNDAAMYYLGTIYYDGKLGTQVDKKKGSELIKVAALKNHSDAINFIKKNNMID
ncbi:7211_t:CDS:10 [Diversispora eburnea]|uniref:7211_t:CDS:1 n=1 Tax=Diversispora eburnea TaxID=1213867 RepID=A0A9N8V7S8_9GLOM|nr:7211_t:CDS:10 [Diversispora eburnea]